MKQTLNFIKQYIIYIAVISLILVLINITVFCIGILHTQKSLSNKDKVASSITDRLIINDNLSYELSKDGAVLLSQNFTWGILIDYNGLVIWKSDHLPEDISLSYTITDIASFSRWYLNDYPVTVWEHSDGLLVLGENKNSVWKIHTNLSQTFTSNIKLWTGLMIVLNIFLAFVLAVFFGFVSSHSILPLIKGIKSLNTKKVLSLSTKGTLGELASYINDASKELVANEIAIKEKDNFRNIWIAGISHDIRTPLSMILGYSDELENNPNISSSAQKEAQIIKYQSIKIRDLVNNLNLGSKLEYSQESFPMEVINITRLYRQEIINFINNGLHTSYIIDFVLPKEMDKYFIKGNKSLLIRVLNNLINNCINHNPSGCKIAIAFNTDSSGINISIHDNGQGITTDDLNKLQGSLISVDSNIQNQRHGLGLIIVKQIIYVHNGSITFDSIKNQGFYVDIKLPLHHKA